MLKDQQGVHLAHPTLHSVVLKPLTPSLSVLFISFIKKKQTKNNNQAASSVREQSVNPQGKRLLGQVALGCKEVPTWSSAQLAGSETAWQSPPADHELPLPLTAAENLGEPAGHPLSSSHFFFPEFIYSRLLWVVSAMWVFFLVVKSGGFSSSLGVGFSLWWLFSLCARASQRSVATHSLSCFGACGIFPYQGLNLCLPHCQADSLPLSHEESPNSHSERHIRGIYKHMQYIWS